MHERLSKYLQDHPYYADIGGDLFIEGMTRVKKFFPRSRIVDFLFSRKRTRKQKVDKDPLIEFALQDDYLKNHVELLPKIRTYVQDRYNKIRKR